MRTTKFRAWDAKYNQMLYGGEIWKRYPNWYPVDYVTNKGVTIWNKRQPNDPEHTWEFERLKMFPEISIMQFTGLKDKNGKEVCEGDILEYEYNRDTETTTKFIEVIEWGEYGDAVGFDIHKSMRYEVIGNIYENENLLK